MGVPVVRNVRCDDERFYVGFADGREASAPLTPRLRAATPKQRANWRVEDFGTALHWPDIDEDYGVAHLLGMTEEELYELAGFTIFPKDD